MSYLIVPPPPHLFPSPCGSGRIVPREGFNYISVIILASLLDVGLPSLFVCALQIVFVPKT